MRKIVPKLRFKEFKENWNKSNFDKVFLFLQNNSFSRDNLNYEKGNVLNIHYGDILTKFNNILKINSKIPYINIDNSLSKYNAESYLLNGDIIFADTAEDLTVGKACEIANVKNEKILSGLHTIPCRPIIKFAPYFLGYYVNSSCYHNQLIPYITGIKVSSISKSNIIKTNICYPNIFEQEKIGKLLNLLDKKIELQKQKIENLKLYKKGLSDILFNTYLNNISYTTIKISKLFEYKNGNSYENSITDNGLYNLISLNSITPEGNLQKKFKKVNTSSWFLQKNDIIMVLSDVGHGDFLGLCDIIPENNTYVLNQRMGLLRIKDNTQIDIPYVRLYIINNQRYFKKHGKGSSQLNLSKGDIENFEVKLPTFSEQNKISQILHYCEKKIILESENLENLILLKQSLLQQLFI